MVAALTIPSLVQNYKIKRKVALLKESYSIIQQSFTMANIKHGESKYWNCPDVDTGKLDSDGNPILDFSGSEELITYISENISADIPKHDYNYKSQLLHGKTASDSKLKAGRYFRLKNGAIVSFGYTDKYYKTGDLIILLPDCAKKVCRLGVDRFYFKVDYKNSRILPFGAPKTVYSLNTGDMKTSCSMNSNNNLNGMACTAWVLYNENMDYLKCDVSWDGKHSCK